jgi:hypothetical protein
MGRTLLWITGGVLVATGMISLYYSFGTPWGDMAENLTQVGWDGVADVQSFPAITVALFGLGLGIPLLVGLNATAWKETGGY